MKFLEKKQTILKLRTKDSFCVVDSEDFGWLKKYKWFLSTAGYAYRSTPKINKRRYNVFMHREIMNAPKKTDIDHINGNKLDNRKLNLRVCSRSSNLWNAKDYKNNTSGFKGVHWQKINKKWNARIQVNGKRVYLGLFESKLKAALAYNKATLKYRDKFATLNKI